jgi:hypothetical protein
MDCYYTQHVEDKFLEYLEDLAEYTEDCYVWVFVEDDDAPRVMDIDVKNMELLGNREAVLLQLIEFFERNGKNFLHQLLEFTLEENRLRTINDVKEFTLDQLFSAMISATFDCEGTHLAIKEPEEEE